MPRLESATEEAIAQAYASTGAVGATAKTLGIDVSGAHRAITTNPHILARSKELIETKFNKLNISAERVMTELARVAFASAKGIFDENGDMIPIHKLPDDVAATITGIDVETRWEGKGDAAVPITMKKIRRADKMSALNTLAKHFKIVGDDNDGVNALASALADRLKAARQRAPLQDVEEARIIPRAIVPYDPAPDEAPKPTIQENDDEQLW